MSLQAKGCHTRKMCCLRLTSYDYINSHGITQIIYLSLDLILV